MLWRPGVSAVVLLLVISVVNHALFPPTALAVNAKRAAPSEKRYYYHLNHLGSVNVITNEKGQVVSRRDYRPYGEPVGWTGPSSGPQEFLLTFGGHRLDEATGLYYLGARHYDAELGRFLTADTQVPDPMNPKSLNRYAFAAGNPIRYIDPTGHSFWDIFLAIFVAVAFFIVAAVLTVVTFGAGLGLFAAGIAFAGALGFLGAGVFAVLAVSAGMGITSSGYWVAVATGFILGAAVGAGLAALPVAFGGGMTFAALGASILVGAMFGAIEETIVHFANGGGPEALMVDLLISAGIGAATSALLFGAGAVAKGFKAAARAVKASARALASIGRALIPVGLGVGRAVHAGLTGDRLLHVYVFRPAVQFVQGVAFGLMGIALLLNYSASPAKSAGLPAWAFAGTWPGAGGGGSGRHSGMLNLMPLAP